MAASLVEGPIRRVVIADDNCEFREILRVMLSYEAGVAIVGEARDAFEVLRLVKEEKPDVLLLDLSMPELDGVDVVTLVPEYSPRTRLIVFSGYDAVILTQRRPTHGTTTVMVKSAGRAALVSAIRSVLRESM